MKFKDFIICILVVIIAIMSVLYVNIENNKTTIARQIIITQDKEKIIFVGDSITERYDLTKYYDYDNKLIINSGVSGYRTNNIISRFNVLVKQHQANKMFLLIGTNDVSREISADDIFYNIKRIINMTKEQSPDTKIYVESVYPVNNNMEKAGKRTNDVIKDINEKLEEYCNQNNIIYINMYDELTDSEGYLDQQYTVDGLHLNDKGYEVVTSKLKKYVEE